MFVLWLRDIRMDASECEAVRSVDHNSSLPEMVPEGLDVEQVWRESARVFAQNFCLIYEDEDVTPYLHQFVYHVGFFLKTDYEELATSNKN